MGVELGVNATDEETGYAGDAAHVGAASRTRGQTFDVSVCDLFVNVARKKEGDVDVDAFADQLADCLDALGSGRNLDHEILAPHCFPEPPCFLQRPGRVIRQQRRDLEAHVAVVAFAFVVYGTQDVRSVLNVFDCDFFVETLGIQAGRFLALDHRLIVGAAYNCLFEDRRIRSNAT